MRKLILAAGVAAMAISAPAAAKPDRGGQGGHSQVQRGGKSQAKAQRGGGQRQARAQRSGGQRQVRAQRGGGQRQAQVQRRGGGQRAVAQRGGRAKAQRIERRGGGQQRVAHVERRGGGKVQRVERRGGQRFANFQTERRGNGKAQRAERNNRQAVRVQNRGHGNRELRADNRGNGNRQFRVANRGSDRRQQRIETQSRGNREARMAMDRREFRDRDFANVTRVRAFNDDRAYRTRDDFRRAERWRGWNDGDWNRAYAFRGIPAAYVGCPPGLAKKSYACVPPGHARSEFVGRVLPNYYSANYFPQSLRYMYADSPDYYYRWGDGYAYRVNRSNNLIAALLPLIGAGYGIGQQFPYMSDPYYYVPSDYQSFYPSYSSEGDYYRYANGYVYEIDGPTGYVENVIPLLDRGYGVGQMLPTSYSYYNVPYQYRSLYYDGDDYYYRYAPGAIYQVDRDSQLITSVASLLTGGLSVGQPLPPAYSAYNVPYQYRTTYFDSPDAWYRYNNGYIYQVDPTTQLITAIVRSIV